MVFMFAKAHFLIAGPLEPLLLWPLSFQNNETFPQAWDAAGPTRHAASHYH